jgi:hypothetical protein
MITMFFDCISEDCFEKDWSLRGGYVDLGITWAGDDQDLPHYVLASPLCSRQIFQEPQSRDAIYEADSFWKDARKKKRKKRKSIEKKHRENQILE